MSALLLHRHRLLGALTLMVCSIFGCAQGSGVKILGDLYHPYIKDGPRGDQGALGLGFDRDLNHRLGWGLDLKYGWAGNGEGEMIAAIYHSKFCFSDNAAPAFYLGSFLGWQRIRHVDHGEAYARTQFPIGVRAGVRGSLDGGFGELFTQFGYAIGNGTLSEDVRTNPLSISIGLCYGTGW